MLTLTHKWKVEFRWFPNNSSYGATVCVNDIIGIAVDMDNGQVQYFTKTS